LQTKAFICSEKPRPQTATSPASAAAARPILDLPPGLLQRITGIPA